MKKLLLASAFISLTAISGLGSIANAAVVPCEDILKTLTDSLATAKLSEADMKAVTELKAKGEERCTAEDDRRAGGFFNDALAIVTKK
jgi:hypothetical protein